MSTKNQIIVGCVSGVTVTVLFILFWKVMLGILIFFAVGICTLAEMCNGRR